MGASPQLGGGPSSIIGLAAIRTQYSSTNLGIKTMQGWWSAQFLRVHVFCPGNELLVFNYCVILVDSFYSLRAARLGYELSFKG